MVGDDGRHVVEAADDEVGTEAAQVVAGREPPWPPPTTTTWVLLVTRPIITT